jgi:hypothetical protein
MLGSVAIVYEKTFSIETLKGLLGAAAAGTVGTWLWSLVKAIPFLGTVAGTIGQMAIAGAVTAVLGYGFIRLLESGKEVNAANLRSAIEEEKDRASQVKEEVKRFYPTIKRVGFKIDPPESATKVRVYFNLRELSSPNLTIFAAVGDTKVTHELQNHWTYFDVDLARFNRGKYFIVLTADNLPKSGVGGTFEKI